MKRSILLLLLTTVLSLGAFAQTTTVSGVITSSEDGEPLIGATVKVKGTTVGTTTDIDGNYTIKVDANGTLQFS